MILNTPHDLRVLQRIKVNEIFPSLQGEGINAGRPRLFIRFSRCLNRCGWCDTKYAMEHERNITEYDLKLLKNHKMWCFTGGEPMLYQQEMTTLYSKFQPEYVEIETCGEVKRQGLETFNFTPNLFTISPKPKFITHPTSIKNKQKNYPLLKMVAGLAFYNYTVKFVYTKNKAYQRFISRTINRFKIDKNKVWIMPLTQNGADYRKNLREAWEYCVKHDYNLSPRIHIEAWGKRRGV